MTQSFAPSYDQKEPCRTAPVAGRSPMRGKGVTGGGPSPTFLSVRVRRLQSRIAALPSCLSLGGLIACTWVSFSCGQSFAFTGFLYLVIVVLAATYGGFWQATIISVAAVGCLNYFFIPPIFSFENSPANWVALGAFEFTALVISRLSRQAQLQALEAIARRRDMERPARVKHCETPGMGVY
jgi:K+-sensing histidine kinase KdpD